MKCCAALLALLLLIAPAHAGRADTVLIVSQAGATLSAIDSKTDQVVGTMPLHKGPATIVAQASTAYVTHPDAGMISVIDLEEWLVRGTFRVPGSPFGIAVSRDDKLFVGDWNGSAIYQIDPATGAQLGAAKAGRAPAHMAVTPDGSMLLVAGRESNTLTIIDTANLQTRATLPVERAPFALAISPDGRHAVVANAQANSVSAVDLVTLKITGSQRSGAMPYGIAFAGAGKALVANQQSGTLAWISEPPSGDAPAALRVGSYPEGVAITTDNRKAYAANWSSDDVSVVDLASFREIARLKVGGGPRSIAVVAGRFGR